MKRVMSAAAAVSMMAGAASAAQLSNVTLFGQLYRVDRFDMDQVQWTNPHPSASVPTLKAFAVISATWKPSPSGDRILLSCNEMDDFLIAGANAWKNYIVEARITTDPQGNPSGLAYVGTTVINDLADPNLDGVDTFDGWDLDTGGITINGGATGLGAGGNLVCSDTELEAAHAYLLNGITQTCPIAFTAGCQTGGGCTAANQFGQFCGFTLSPNQDNEDIIWMPAGPSGQPEFWTVWQDFPSQMTRFSTSGMFLGQFPIAEQLDPIIGDPKGMTFIPNTPTAPAALRVGTGVALVTLDDIGPGLQVFATNSATPALVASQRLVEPGPNGFFDTPPSAGDDVYFFGDKADYSGVLQLEAAAYDAATGRLILVNEGVGFVDNYLYVLTPIRCAGDANADGRTNGADLSVLLGQFNQSVTPGTGGDFNNDGTVNGADLSILLGQFGCGN